MVPAVDEFGSVTGAGLGVEEWGFEVGGGVGCEELFEMLDVSRVVFVGGVDFVLLVLVCEIFGGTVVAIGTLVFEEEVVVRKGSAFGRFICRCIGSIG